MNEFTFERSFSPWEHALSRLKPGDTLSAVRFLELLVMDDSIEPEEAALQLEELCIELEVSELPAPAAGADADRLELELRCYASGTLLENLEGNDPLRLALLQLKKTLPLTDEERLAKLAAAGQEWAMEQLTNGYLPYVYELAGEYLGHGVLLMDLVQEGSLGLWQSVLQFEDGCFRSHARGFIRRAMARAVALQAHAGGVGERLRRAMERYREADRVLLARLGRNPGEEEIAQEMGVTPEEAMTVGKTLREARVLEQVRQSTRPKEPTQEDEQAVEDTAYYQSRSRIDELLSRLDPQSASIVSLRFGLDGKGTMSAAEVAAKLGLTVEQVQEKEAAAMLTLREDR